VSAVTDTLGRVFNFAYYEGGGAAFNIKDITQTWNGTTYTWAHFDYVDVTFSTNFGTLAVEGPANGSQRSMLHRVTTLDGAHWAFGYNSYGLVNLFYRFGADYLQLAVKSMVYNIYGGAMADCPRVRQTADHGWDWNAGWVTTGDYDIDPDRVDATTGARWGAVTTADGTLHKEFFGARDGVSPEATTAPPWLHGLTTETQTWAGGVKQKWAKTIWTQDDTALTYPKNPRVTETNVYDGAAGNRRRTTVSYRTVTPPGGTPFSLPSDVTEYDWQNSTSTPYRTTRTEYEEGAAYLNRRILGLPRFQYLYQGQGLAGDALASKVEYVYDDGALDTLPAAAVQHDAAWGGTARGNPTRVRRHDVSIPGAFVESRTKYNVTGAATELTNPRGSKTDLGYADSFWVTTDSQPSGYNTFAYPTSVTVHDVDANNAPVAFTSYARYHFSFGALTRSQDPKGAVVTRKYDWAGRLEKATTQAGGADYAYTRYSYSNSHNYVQSYTTVNDLNPANEAYAITLFDGHGRVRASVGDHYTATNPNGTPDNRYSSVYRAYDNMGRLSQWSNPTEINSIWEPVGDDAAGYIWSQQAYDWQGRPTVTTNQDGTTREVQYSGCGCAGGQVTTLIDEVGRRQRVRQDVFGRTDKAEVLKQNAQNPSQWDVYSTTITAYNLRDQVTAVKVYQGLADSSGACATGGCRQAIKNYDGYGRLSSFKRPIEADGTATTYSYYADDSVQTVTDARGASQTFSYNNRGLVRDIVYGGSFPTSGVSYSYDEAGNRTWMTDGIGWAEYHYNSLSQIDWEKRYFNAIGTAYQIDYTYNLAGQPKSLQDSFGDRIEYNYDKSGRLNSLNGPNDNQTTTPYLNNLKYRAWGATKEVSYATGFKNIIQFNARLQAASYEVSKPGQTIIRRQFSYYSDGNLKLASSLNLPADEKYDLAMQYDHTGLVKEAYSGQGARDYVSQSPVNTDPALSPYRYSYQHNVWGEKLTKTGYNFSVGVLDSASYNHQGRRDGLLYDSAGNVTDDGFNTLQYDALGYNGLIISKKDPNEVIFGKRILQKHDGDGITMERQEDLMRIFPDGSASVFSAGPRSHYLRSTVLGGQIVAEISYNTQTSTYQKGGGYVYDGAVKVGQYTKTAGQIYYQVQHKDPVTGTVSWVVEDGAGWTQAYLDPEGLTVAEPIQPEPASGDGSDKVAHVIGESGDDSECIVDGMYMYCQDAGRLQRSGAASYAPSASFTQIYDPIRERYVWAIWQSVQGANGNTYAGYLPTTATYQGQGEWTWNRDATGTRLRMPGEGRGYIGGGYGASGEADGVLGEVDGLIGSLALQQSTKRRSAPPVPRDWTVRDSADRMCKSAEIELIVLRNRVNTGIPHTWLQVRSGSWGWGPVKAGRSGLGEVKDNSDTKEYPINSSSSIDYRACPETMRLLEESIKKAKQAGGYYNYKNVLSGKDGGYNCSGWACKRLEEAGIKPPYSSDTACLFPDNLPKHGTRPGCKWWSW
jgi:hypothetical protein